MKNSVLVTILAALLAMTTSGFAGHEHDYTLYTSPLTVNAEFRLSQVLKGADHSQLAGVHDEGPLIIVRYLGFGCTHCVQQLTYLNEYATELKNLGVHVVALSEDDEETNRKLVDRMRYDPDVMHIVSDEDNAVAQEFGAYFMRNDTLFDLHAVVVVNDGRVRLSILSDQPYMNINKLVAEAVRSTKKAETTQEDALHPVDLFLSRPTVIREIAGPADNLNGPVDLDFDQSPLHPNDLWVVCTDQLGHRMAIIHDATTENRTIDIRKDSRASHFMWRTMGIAMGDNGAFCTAQNGERGDFDPFYQFMGPTLWSSDTAVFARANQDSRRLLGSHLDMLHQSPNLYGVAFDHDNVYWVSDQYYGNVARYDFQDPHEVGGHDHTDGIVRKYDEAVITTGERGRPAHMDLDDNKQWLYYVDPGTNSVHRLDTRTGSMFENIVPPEESYEDHQEYTSWKGASVEALITEGLGEPVGLEVVGNRLLIGDRLSGKIFIYMISHDGVEHLGSVETGAEELCGIVYGPDARLWFTDRALGTVNYISLENQPTFTAVRDVQVYDSTAIVLFSTMNQGSEFNHTAYDLVARELTDDGYGEADTLEEWSIGVASGETTITEVDVTPLDPTKAYFIEMIQKTNPTYGGLRAHTLLVPRSAKRVIVDDALTELFRIIPAVRQTDRDDYLALPSDVFLRAADSLSNLELAVWNVGSFGDVNAIDDAVINSLVKRDVEIFLIGDDPLLMRTNLPLSIQFFAQFGASMRGVDEVVNDNGQRVFQGVVGDTISGGMTNIDLQLPALEHDRGGQFVPNILFRTNGSDAFPVLTREGGSLIGAVRKEDEYRRSVILGFNIAHFLDGRQRTEFMDRALTWLENAPREVEQDTTQDTTVSVHEDISKGASPLVTIHGNPAVSTTTIQLAGTHSDVAVGIYSVSGQLIRDVWHGGVDRYHTITVDVERLSSGTYFVIARTPTGLGHATFVKR